MNIISVDIPLPLQTKSMELQLDLVLNSEAGGDLSDFITNGEWYLLGEYFSLPIFGIICVKNCRDRCE